MVALADGVNKSGNGRSGGGHAIPSMTFEDDETHPTGKDEGSSWTTATVQSTSAVEPEVGRPHLAAAAADLADDSLTMTGSPASDMETSQSSLETMQPIDSFLTPSSSICSQQDYEILKASSSDSLFLIYRSFCGGVRID